MSQLSALFWLKLKLFRNALRSRRAVTNRVASALGMMVALAFALIVAGALGFAAYALNSTARTGVDAERMARESFVFLFFIFVAVFVMWGVVPLGLGSGNQFDPRRFLLYPVSMSKIFVTDLLSDLVSLSSVYAVPVALAVALGAGAAMGRALPAFVLGLFAILFGMSFAKFLATSIGALLRKRRTRGETLLALLGAIVALAGTFAGQLARLMMPHLSRYEGMIYGLWWIPPGAVASGLTEGLRPGGAATFLLAATTLGLYALVFIALTFWVARRAALETGGGRAKKARAAKPAAAGVAELTGWRLPFVSAELSAVIEKELRYVARNAQVRLLVVMPLIIVGLRLVRRSGAEKDKRVLEHAGRFVEFFERYGQGLTEAGGVLYIFLLLSALACNLFAFEEGGMTAYVLAPVERRTILLGKNAVVTFVAFAYTLFFLVVTEIAFRDLTAASLVFVALCFATYAPLSALVGNWLSMRFPRRLAYGKRMNLTGVPSLLLLPLMLLMALVPLASVFAGYFAQSLLVKYVTLATFAVVALLLYAGFINEQGRALDRRQLDILDTVSGRNET